MKGPPDPWKTGFSGDVVYSICMPDLPFVMVLLAQFCSFDVKSAKRGLK
jgi:hypothetical protein